MGGQWGSTCGPRASLRPSRRQGWAAREHPSWTLAADQGHRSQCSFWECSPGSYHQMTTPQLPFGSWWSRRKINLAKELTSAWTLESSHIPAGMFTVWCGSTYLTFLSFSFCIWKMTMVTTHIRVWVDCLIQLILSAFLFQWALKLTVLMHNSLYINWRLRDLNILEDLMLPSGITS